MKTIHTSPDPLPRDGIKIFLAGSIEQGKAKRWQEDIYKQTRTTLPVAFINPYRKEWNPAWEQSMENENFVRQVVWELKGIERSDAVFFYFQEDTKAPIALLELGLVLGMKKPTVIVCPKAFWRHGNVQITTTMYGVKVYETIEDGIVALENLLRTLA